MGEENQDEIDQIENRWSEITEIVDSYIDSIGARCRKPERIDKILNMSYDEIKRLGHEECGENAFILSQYAYYLQQEYNLHKSKFDWCELTLTYFVANYGEKSQYIKTLEKGLRLSSTNDNVRKLIKMLSYVKTVMSTLEALSYKVSSMCHAMESLQQTKRKYNG